jgi:hypothetical protein
MIVVAVQRALCSLGNDNHLTRPQYMLVAIDLDSSRAVNSDYQHIDFRIDMAIDSLASGARYEIQAQVLALMRPCWFPAQREPNQVGQIV